MKLFLLASATEFVSIVVINTKQLRNITYYQASTSVQPEHTIVISVVVMYTSVISVRLNKTESVYEQQV